MHARLICATLAFACIASAAPAQTVVGPEAAAGKYNRLHDFTYRPQNGAVPATPEIFGTAAVSAGVTFYDARFRRVSSTDRTAASSNGSPSQSNSPRSAAGSAR